MEIFQHRKGLASTIKALKEGSLTLGFIGGSITDPRPGHNWPEPVTAWFVEEYPDVRIIAENAAIGATGSDLAVFRAERDLVGRGCELVFVEFAVNDYDEPTEKRMRTREGLIRKLLAGEGRDVVLVYTYRQEMYEDMINGRVPSSIREFEQLASHYGLGSIWMGLSALDEVRRGRMKWDEWLPDGLHPQYRGSLCYASSVIRFLERELQLKPGKGETALGAGLPAPVNPRNWERAHVLPYSDVSLKGPWSIRRSHSLVWMDQLLVTTAPGAGLSFSFEGRGLSLGFAFGSASAEFRYRIDEAEWAVMERDRPDWAGRNDWYRIANITDELEAGRHTFELEVIHGNRPGCIGTEFNLAFIGITG